VFAFAFVSEEAGGRASEMEIEMEMVFVLDGVLAGLVRRKTAMEMAGERLAARAAGAGQDSQDGCGGADGGAFKIGRP
jgi:hypothetical protein